MNELANLSIFQKKPVVLLNTANESTSLGSHYDKREGKVIIEPFPDFETLRRTKGIIDVVIGVPIEYEHALDEAFLGIDYPDSDLLPIVLLKIPIEGDSTLYQGQLKPAEETSSKTLAVLKGWLGALETVTGVKQSLHSSDLQVDLLFAHGPSEESLDDLFQLYAHERNSLSEETARWLSELHESSHGQLDRSHLKEVEKIWQISQHEQFGDLIRHRIGMSRWMDYDRMLSELNILDEAIATFHSLTGQKMISDDRKEDLSVGTNRFSLSLLAVHVAYGLIPASVVEYDVHEPIATGSEHPDLFVSVGDPISNMSRSRAFLFQGDLESDKTPPEPHVASALLLLAGGDNLRTDCRSTLLVNGASVDPVDRVRYFIGHPEDVPKFLNLSFYSKLLKAYANRVEEVKEIANQIVEVFESEYETDNN